MQPGNFMRFRSMLLWTGLAWVFASDLAIGAEADSPQFESDVRPILKAHCWQCHGEVDELKGELDTRLARFLRKGGESGAAIVPGRHRESLLYQRVASGEMPPGSKRLSAKEVAVLARWIDSGAPTLRPEPETLPREAFFTTEERRHWAFQPIRRSTLPNVTNPELLRSPIDAFLLSRLESQGLSFGSVADRPALIRRLTFDLHGLPPTPEAVDRFVADVSPDAYERLVDRLLESPAYGERWARHWLDVAGYADSDGVTKDDRVRGWAWKYRDYVIRSFNASKPWDEFLVEQIAGDELLTPPYSDLAPAQAERLIATGFLRMAPDATEGTVPEPDVARNQVVAEVIKVASTSLLGLSVGCAQCHSHRYDPITHTDYYRMRAVFEPAYDWKNWRGPGGRLISQWTKETRELAAAVDKEVAGLKQLHTAELDAAADQVIEERVIAKLPEELREKARAARKAPKDKRTDEQKKLVEEHPFLKINGAWLDQIDGAPKAKIDKKWKPLIDAAAAKRPARDMLMCLSEVPGKVSTTFLFARGDFKQPRDEVAPSELSVLNPDGVEIPSNNPKLPTTGRRLAWARHLTSGRHPLVARVLVNRFWMHHFGKGLVATPADFGLQGERPSHPELLDWLAAEFMESGWNLKHLHRLILTSTAYRQAATRRQELDAVDPDNRLLGRMPVRRLETEAVRDSLLALSGRLSTRMHGPPSPVSLDSVGQRVIISANQYDPTGRLLRNVKPLGEETVRRTIYVQVRRSMPLGVLVPFNPPAMKPNCELRTSSTDSTQSLMMMNDPFVIDQVNALAARVVREAGENVEPRFRRAWRLVFGRAPDDDEVRGGLEFLNGQTAAVRDSSSDRSDPDVVALAHLCHALVSSNAFLYVD